MKPYLLSAALAALFCTTAQASVVIDATQSGSNVVFTATGSIDLSGATLANTYPTYDLGIIPGGNNWYYAEGSSGSVNGYAFTSFAGPFGTTQTYFNSPSSSTGEDFAIWGQGGVTPQMLISSSYVSGSAFTGGLVFDGESLASLGLTAGTYVYTLPDDTITLNISASAVPEPACLALMGLALVGVVATRRRR